MMAAAILSASWLVFKLNCIGSSLIEPNLSANEYNSDKVRLFEFSGYLA